MNENQTVTLELTPVELNLLTGSLLKTEDGYRITERAETLRAKEAAKHGETYLQNWHEQEAAAARNMKDATHVLLGKLTTQLSPLA